MSTDKKLRADSNYLKQQNITDDLRVDILGAEATRQFQVIKERCGRRGALVALSSAAVVVQALHQQTDLQVVATLVRVQASERTERELVVIASLRPASVVEPAAEAVVADRDDVIVSAQVRKVEPIVEDRAAASEIQ